MCIPYCAFPNSRPSSVTSHLFIMGEYIDHSICQPAYSLPDPCPVAVRHTHTCFSQPPFRCSSDNPQPSSCTSTYFYFDLSSSWRLPHKHSDAAGLIGQAASLLYCNGLVHPYPRSSYRLVLYRRLCPVVIPRSRPSSLMVVPFHARPPTLPDTDRWQLVSLPLPFR